MERERERERDDSPPPRRAGGRPAFLRRQSSLDTFDRKPLVRYEREAERLRDEYGPPARRPDVRPPPLTPVPLPRARGLPPPRRYAERDYDEIKPIPKELEKEKSSDEGEGVTREEVAMKEEATEVIARRAVRPPQEALEARVLAHLIVALRYQ
ncbi:hypothetical protein BofuT4_P050170.1 [Botrytis cinerea T4]|uniref:Uncharacterized protein n=1 Tax=Botryotinia fuckeliana (strain T4) TaxID=999810 RepID=G2XZW2_BOTF4|nr:hypothetical protein BofuT4_P050170.1 [Botrytis cinerea T4]